MQTTAPSPSLAVRCANLGTVCLVLSILQFIASLFRMAGSLAGQAVVGFQRRLLVHGTDGPQQAALMDLAQAFGRRIALWESLRALPFLAATLLLFWIALRLRRGELEAIMAARNWVWLAFGAIACSVLLQAIVIFPATLAYQKQASVYMFRPSGAGHPPAPIDSIFSGMTLAITLFGMAANTLWVSIWPIVLRLWTGRLLAEQARLQSAPEGEAT